MRSCYGVTRLTEIIVRDNEETVTGVVPRNKRQRRRGDPSVVVKFSRANEGNRNRVTSGIAVTFAILLASLTARARATLPRERAASMAVCGPESRNRGNSTSDRAHEPRSFTDTTINHGFSSTSKRCLTFALRSSRMMIRSSPRIRETYRATSRKKQMDITESQIGTDSITVGYYAKWST